MGKQLGKHKSSDNGNEFYDHQRIAEKLSLKTYFCDPYKSYQKGSVENGNRLLREYFPRNYLILEQSDKLINGCLQKINNRPMKCLGYWSPSEVFKKKAVMTA